MQSMRWGRNIFLYLTPLLMALTAVSCLRLGPPYHRPEPAFRIPAAYVQATTSDVQETIQNRWWEAFQDSHLNEIVLAAVHNNLDLKEAFERVLETRYRLFQTRADRYPFVGVDGEASRTGQTVTVTGWTGLPQRKDVTAETYRLSLPASFELDFWGRLASLEEAARWQLLAAEENRRIVLQTVVAETVLRYLQIEFTERRIQVLEQSIQDYQRSLELARKRYERGLAPVLDLRQARRVLYQAEAELPPLQRELGMRQHQLAVLLDRYPETRPARTQPDDYFQQLAPVPAGIPSDLLRRRPDIRAAESRLRSLNAAVAVSIANRFPRFTLTAAFGYGSEKLHLLFQPYSEWWQLAAGLTAPIFDAGRLQAQHDVSVSQYRQAAFAYARTVLNAFAEVEDVLLERKKQFQSRQRLVLFLQEARITQEVAENRYRRGLIDYLRVLEAQQTRYAAEQRLIQEDFLIYSNRVSLHRVIGGGWDAGLEKGG
jgi:outer membrane protein, multidrug efflux system